MAGLLLSIPLGFAALIVGNEAPGLGLYAYLAGAVAVPMFVTALVVAGARLPKAYGTTALRLIGIPAAIAMIVCGALIVVAIESVALRHENAYTWAYGRTVSIRLPRTCTRHSGPNTFYATCDHVTWTVGGRTVHGDLTLSPFEYQGSSSGVVQAHALGTSAVTRDMAKRVGPEVRLTRIPAWIGVVGLVGEALLVPAFLLGARARRRRPAARP